MAGTIGLIKWIYIGGGMSNQDLRKAGLKVTLPRLRILEALENSKARHLSAEEVYQQLINVGEEVGIATVYRVLTQFEQAGLVIRHNFENDHAVFELNQGAHHDHLVCVKCGRVEEFIDEIIEKRQAEIAKKHQFEITDHVMNIYGICKTCKK